MGVFTMYAPERCEALESPSMLNFAISLIILVGILVSYLSQHYRIIARRSSEGISPYFVLLGTTSGTCALANILVMPSSRDDMACCKFISGFNCFAALLGVMQVAMQWACFTTILLLFLIFFPRDKPRDLPSGAPAPSYRVALSVMAICVIHALITALFNAVIVYVYPSRSQAYANALGIIATLLAAIQYIPQLWTTWRLKTVGSLSIPMMLLQTPGSFLWAGSLAARVGWEGWSIWSIFAVTGCFQGVLLAMGITFELKRHKNLRDAVIERDPAEDSPEDVVSRTQVERSDERTPLLRDE